MVYVKKGEAFVMMKKNKNKKKTKNPSRKCVHGVMRGYKKLCTFIRSLV